MNRRLQLTICLTFAAFVCGATLQRAAADEDKHGKQRERKREHSRDEDHGQRDLKQIDNPVYKEECSVCHVAYQPALLPSASWTRLLTNLDDHFGESVELDGDAKREIVAYLEANGADRSRAERAVKIMRSLDGRVPLRITEVPYIQEKHHDISAAVLKRKAIGSLSNCSACHTTAERGLFDDDHVRIPD